MSKPKPVAPDGRDLALHNHIRAAVAGYLKQVGDLIETVNDLGPIEVSDFKRIIVGLDYARDQLIKLEVKIATENQTQGGTQQDFDINFDDIRNQIGGRLDKLRRANRPKGVSG